MPLQIPGLPEGVLCVRIGQAKPEEFQMHGEAIRKGTSVGASQVIIAPAEGYEFVYDITINRYRCIPKWNGTKRKLVAEFEFTNSLDYDRAVRSIWELAGYVKSTVTEDNQPFNRHRTGTPGGAPN